MIRTTLIAATVAAMSFGAHAVVQYDQTVTPNTIMGTGVTNGEWTVDTNSVSGVELGLRGKLRFNASGQPENTWNSNGDGTYSFAAGVAPTKLAPVAVWSFEWSINSDYNGNGGALGGLTYLLGVDQLSHLGTSFVTFDPIHGVNPGNGMVLWDHAMGTNSTTQSGGTTSATVGAYTAAIAANNVAQNSWQAHWFIAPFDPTADGVYDFFLAAYDANGGEVARTNMKVIVGAGSAVPEPASLALVGLALAGLAVSRRRKQIK